MVGVITELATTLILSAGSEFIINKFKGRGKNRDILSEREALEFYIIPLKDHFDYWRVIIKESRIPWTASDKVNEFIGVYLSREKFRDIKNKSYLLPRDLEDTMNEFFISIDEYRRMNPMLILDKHDDEVLELIETVRAALEEASKTLGRV